MNKDLNHKWLWRDISPNIIWSVIFQMKHLPLELCKIIFNFTYEIDPIFKKNLLNATVQKKFDLWKNIAIPYCKICGEYEMPPLLTGEHRNYCCC